MTAVAKHPSRPGLVERPSTYVVSTRTIEQETFARSSTLRGSLTRAEGAHTENPSSLKRKRTGGLADSIEHDLNLSDLLRARAGRGTFSNYRESLQG